MKKFDKYLEIVQEGRDYSYNEGKWAEIYNKGLGIAGLLGLTIFAPIIQNLDNNFYANKRKEEIINSIQLKADREKSYVEKIINNFLDEKKVSNIQDILKKIMESYKQKKDATKEINNLKKSLKKDFGFDEKNITTIVEEIENERKEISSGVSFQEDERVAKWLTIALGTL